MPMRVLEPLATELPKLEAEASLRRAQETFVAGGLDPKSRGGLISAWKRAAAGGGAVAVRRPQGHRDALARAAGIGVRTVPRKAPEP